MELALGLATTFAGAVLAIAGYTKRSFVSLMLGKWDAPGSASGPVQDTLPSVQGANAASGGVYAPGGTNAAGESVSTSSPTQYGGPQAPKVATAAARDMSRLTAGAAYSSAAIVAAANKYAPRGQIPHAVAHEGQVTYQGGKPGVYIKYEDPKGGSNTIWVPIG